VPSDEQLAAQPRRTLEIQRKTPCRVSLDDPISETHFWVYTGDEPEIGQECACGLAVWPYKPEFPHLDLREAS
jgi:hypothetical protein